MVALAEKIPDALSGVVKEARAGELKEPALDAMLDGISARCEATVKQYGATTRDGAGTCVARLRWPPERSPHQV
ncbi:hypothetical protein CO675_27600 [Bradyrhizobium sp. C9]|nr:hypothetical protein CO675_27600 [Bradyrhizobium sp. C9]